MSRFSLAAIVGAALIVTGAVSAWAASGTALGVNPSAAADSKGQVRTLTVGADNLVLADPNEEGAKLLALNTRQQLSQTALSLANQADQGVLRLFG